MAPPPPSATPAGLSADELKRLSALRACEHVKSGMTLGLGTGSTAAHAVKRIGEMLAKGEISGVRGIPTSEATRRIAESVNIPLVTLDDVDAVDLTIDGADEVDPQLDLIKGLGGALLREKVVASVTAREIIIVDASKIVDRLGTKAPLPVEVLPFARRPVEQKLRAMGLEPVLRVKDGKPFVTDNGNLVLDAHAPRGFDNARAIEQAVNNIPGVVENGFFLGLTWKVVIAEADGKIREMTR